MEDDEADDDALVVRASVGQSFAPACEDDARICPVLLQLTLTDYLYHLGIIICLHVYSTFERCEL